MILYWILESVLAYRIGEIVDTTILITQILICANKFSNGII